MQFVFQYAKYMCMDLGYELPRIVVHDCTVEYPGRPIEEVAAFADEKRRADAEQDQEGPDTAEIPVVTSLNPLR